MSFNGVEVEIAVAVFCLMVIWLAWKGIVAYYGRTRRKRRRIRVDMPKTNQDANRALKEELHAEVVRSQGAIGVTEPGKT